MFRRYAAHQMFAAIAAALLAVLTTDETTEAIDRMRCEQILRAGGPA